ncbi:MAG: Jag N-terminal domain-containing protein [Oscillospiraceae bacterium]|nr:Jag N-terminal domain-containing protein [Oscillospiraceae bacterium]
MTKFIDVRAKSEEEAVAKGLAELGLERDDVSVEILERSKSGFLGIGSAPALVRLSYEAPDEVEAAAPVREEAPRKENKEKGERREKRERKEKKEEPAEQSAVPAASESVDLGEQVDDEKAQQIRAFLTGLLEKMENSAEVEIYAGEKNRYKVILKGEKLGSLIGRRGETLDAIQQLTNYSVNRHSESKGIRVQVDAEGYREKREQSLERLAAKVAAKVVKYRRNVTLEPMNAYERHVIHAALQDTPNVTTFSVGTEPNRRIIVSYDRGGNK